MKGVNRTIERELSVRLVIRTPAEPIYIPPVCAVNFTRGGIVHKRKLPPRHKDPAGWQDFSLILTAEPRRLQKLRSGYRRVHPRSETYGVA